MQLHSFSIPRISIQHFVIRCKHATELTTVNVSFTFHEPHFLVFEQTKVLPQGTSFELHKRESTGAFSMPLTHTYFDFAKYGEHCMLQNSAPSLLSIHLKRNQEELNQGLLHQSK